MKKLLYILNVAPKINNFSYTSMIAAQKSNIDFHIAGNWSYTPEERLAAEKQYGIKIHQIDFVRTPYHPKNQTAYKQLKKLIQNENYDAIHCNTPIGGLLGRIAGKKCKIKKIIYQVHGFHFYNGAPKKNWLLYYPIEKRLARHTDALITINNEDFALAKSKFKLRNNGRIYYVPGVGIDTTQYRKNPQAKKDKRAELNLPPDAFILLSVGELNTNKNNAVIIAALEQLHQPKIHYVLCGVGKSEAPLKAQAAAAGLENNVHFLGYRSDIAELYAMADCFVMPSFREGLSRSLMEAMASGLPCIASKIRGNTDLLDDAAGGFLCDTQNIPAYAEKINLLASDSILCHQMSQHNLDAIQKFSTDIVIEEIQKIYHAEFNQE